MDRRGEKLRGGEGWEVRGGERGGAGGEEGRGEGQEVRGGERGGAGGERRGEGRGGQRREHEMHCYIK